VGVIDDLEKRAGADALKAGDALVLIGAEGAHLGQSILLRDVLGRRDGAAPPVDLSVEKRNGDLVRGLITDGVVSACHDLSDGGLAVAAAEMALASNIGVALGYQGEASDVAFLFGEDQGRYLIGVSEARMPELERRANAAGAPFLVVGEAGGAEVSYLGASGERERVSLVDLRAAHESWLPAYMKRAS